MPSKPGPQQIKIARDTLKMSDAGANIMGGMSKKEAVSCLRDSGMSDEKIKAFLKQSDHSDDEISKLMEDFQMKSPLIEQASKYLSEDEDAEKDIAARIRAVKDYLKQAMQDVDSIAPDMDVARVDEAIQSIEYISNILDSIKQRMSKL